MEQSREPTSRKRIRGEVDQGEQAQDRHALSAKPSSQIRRLCGEGHEALISGGLALCLKGRLRRTEREVSSGRRSRRDTAEASTSALGEGVNGRESEATVSPKDAECQKPPQTGAAAGK